MFSIEKYHELSEKYGKLASWAIWDYRNPNDTRIIEKNLDQLNSRFVLLGLNFSKILTKNWQNWSNFHSNSHDRKLKYACNDSNLRGSYMTDLFKNVVKSRSTNIEKMLSYKKIMEDVEFFREEMENIELNENSQFIIFGSAGSTTVRLFNRYYKKYFKNKTINYYHYSYFTFTDKEWVEGFWKKLEIKQNYNAMIQKYISQY